MYPVLYPAKKCRCAGAVDGDASYRAPDFPASGFSCRAAGQLTRQTGSLASWSAVLTSVKGPRSAWMFQVTLTFALVSGTVHTMACRDVILLQL